MVSVAPQREGTRRRHRSVAVALKRLRNAPTILAALERFDAVATAAWRDDPEVSVPLLRDAIDDVSDQVTALAAIHALAAVPDPVTAPAAMLALLQDWRPHVREHAAWALATAPVEPLALPHLVEMVCRGGFSGTLAQMTLESWAKTAPTEVRLILHGTLAMPRPESQRLRLIDTLGLVPGRQTERILAAIVADPLEGPATTSAAEAALAELGAVNEPPASAVGLTVAQLFLHADIDPELRHAGQGDTGGIATLLVHLGDALLAHEDVRRVLTISRGRADATVPTGLDVPGHHFLPIPLSGPVRHTGNAWPLRVAARRGLAQVLRAAGPVDVIHLRMADVGSWVAAELASTLGIPTVLTMAPDPHALIASRDAAGTLTRAGFGEVDAAEHLVFRVQLLRDLADQAAQLVVFPRPDLARDMRVLLGIDPSRESHRVTVVPEGIDVAAMDRTLLDVRAATPSPATAGALAELDALLATLPPGRRDLPLALSVGRLHRVKGMATLVETWARHPELAERCNLLIVGGDLDDPNADEKEQLDRIHALRDRHPDAPVGGLLLAGHRPNSTVAVWLAAARFGRPGLAAPHGVYVSASLKEEFGIAILEAMAAGLVVVAPDGGGPATYVDDGVTGYLVDTTSRGALAEAIVDALDLAAAPGTEERAEEARALVRGQFSIDTMAATLGAVYQQAVARRRAGTAERETPS